MHKTITVTSTPQAPTVKEDALPGLVFSTDRLRFGPNGDTYWFCLTKQPKGRVTVTVEDPSHCTTSTRALKVDFTPKDWDKPKRVRALFASGAENGLCPQGLVHSCESTEDADYHGFHARLWIDFPHDVLGTEEKMGEWVPEEVLEAEEEGPQMDLAGLDRSRSAFNFLSAQQFHCRKLSDKRDALQCVLGFGTLDETPFYVIDPIGGIEDDGWNGFPLVFIMGGSHGNEAAGAAAAIQIAKHVRPTRGRLVILPYANIQSLRIGHRLIPKVGQHFSDLNRNFPVDGAPQGELAQLIWSLIVYIRPDMFLDLHEGWGYYTRSRKSKGSSVICTEDAKLMGRYVLARINNNNGTLTRDKRFELLYPPILGGLARKLNHMFRTRGLVLETTKTDQPLRVRVKQHLEMVTSALSAANMIHENKNGLEDADLDCLLFIGYAQDFNQGKCLNEKDGAVKFNQ